MSAVAAKYKEYEALDVQVISVSVDSVFIHKIWNEQELSKMVEGGIPFPMVEDKGGYLGEIYGVYDEIAGIDTRGRFLIDPDGIIQAFEVLTPPVGRNVNEALRQIKAFQLVRKTSGTEVEELTPSGWQEGGTTLKPTMDAIGNIWKQWTTDQLK